MTMRYVLSVSLCIVRFLANLFVQERLTAKEAMAHPYFAPIRDEATLQQYLAGGGGTHS